VLLLVSLGILAVTLNVIWPDFRPFRWMDLASVVTLGLSTLGVGAWTFGAWLSD
jgi:hypothetical protein